MSNSTSQQQPVPHHGSLSSYLIGFIASLILTTLSYFTVTQGWASGNQVLAILLGLAFTQLAIQLWFFLHLPREDKPRWNAIFLFNTMGVIALIVIGSILIMNNLNDRMMSPEEMEKYMLEESQKGF